MSAAARPKLSAFTADEPHKKQILSPIFVKASDPVASVYGAFGKFTSSNGIALSDVKKVMITGVGSAFWRRIRSMASKRGIYRV